MLERRTIPDQVTRKQIVDVCSGAKPVMAWIGSLMQRGNGSFEVWVPQGTTEERALTFKWSPGLEKGNLDPRLEGLKRYLSEHAQGLALIEDHSAKASDPWLAQYNGEVHTVGDVVYWVKRGDELRDERPFSGDFIGDSWWVDAVLLCPTDTLLNSIRSGAFDGQRNHCEDLVDQVWFDAYDKDGYVVWTP